MRACLVLVPCLPPGARSMSLDCTLEGEQTAMCEPSHTREIKKALQVAKAMKIAIARLPTGTGSPAGLWSAKRQRNSRRWTNRGGARLWLGLPPPRRYCEAAASRICRHLRADQVAARPIGGVIA